MRTIVVTMIAAIGVILGMPQPLAAQQQSYNETGWRSASEGEKAARAMWERAKARAPDGKLSLTAHYDCVASWMIMSTGIRQSGDIFPTISGDLSFVMADGQMSHHLATLVARENGDQQRVLQGLKDAVGRSKSVVDMNDTAALLSYLGTCHVQPPSWQLDENFTMTGPILSDLLKGEENPQPYPVYVRDTSARHAFDMKVLRKDFVGAANHAAALHASPATKSTVYWHEVLYVSELAVAAGQGTQLSSGLLKTLSEVWWPKSRRAWAKALLSRKNRKNNPPRSDAWAKLLEEPEWSKRERDYFRRGLITTPPCNQWNRGGC